MLKSKLPVEPKHIVKHRKTGNCRLASARKLTSVPCFMPLAPGSNEKKHRKKNQLRLQLAVRVVALFRRLEGVPAARVPEGADVSAIGELINAYP